MKRRLIFYTIILLSLPWKSGAQSLWPYRSSFNGVLRDWAASFEHFKLEDFRAKPLVNQFEQNYTVKARNAREFYPTYRAALSLSPDGRQVLDIYRYLLLESRRGRLVSSGSDVEQSILLGDIRSKKWRQIAYYGYARRVQEVYWVDNDTFILAGARLDATGRNIPVIVLGDIPKQRFTVFEPLYTQCYQKPAGYTSPKLNALHIRAAN